MIRNNVISLTKNLREAARHRLELRNSKLESERKRDLESLFLSRRNFFKRLKFYNLTFNKIVKAEEVSSIFKNYSFFLYYTYKNEELLKDSKEDKRKEFQNLFKSLSKDLLLLEEELREIDLEFNSKITKAKVYKFFKEKGFSEFSQLIDLKTQQMLKPSESLSTENDLLSLKELFKETVSVDKVRVFWDESFRGEFITPIDISEDSSYITREDKVYNFVIAKKERLNGDMLNKHKDVELALSFSFNSKRSINEIAVSFASELPIVLESSKVYYEDNGWNIIPNISFSKEKSKTDYCLYFDTIKTKKIKLVFKQSKYFDTAKYGNKSLYERSIVKLLNGSNLAYSEMLEEEVSCKIYDLSIKQISFFNKKYKGYGFYQEADVAYIKNMQSFNMRAKVLKANTDTYIEKSVQIALYGDKDQIAYEDSTKPIKGSLRLNTVIPLPTNEILEEELLVFKGKVAKCNLFPNVRKEGVGSTIGERIFVYKDDILLAPFEDYNISLNDLSDFVLNTQSLGQIEVNNPEKLAGLFHIELTSKPDFNSKYTVKYYLDKDFSLEDSHQIKLKDGVVVLSESLRSSKGYLRPRFVFRSVSKECETSIIKEYELLIEEEDSDEVDFLDHEDIKELEGRGTENVI